MTHKNHFDSDGKLMPSVSQVPNISSEIFFNNLSGYYEWICEQTHKKDAPYCCYKASQDFYKASSNLGKDIHSLREAFLKGESFDEGVPEYQAKLFDPIARFYKESEYEAMFIEKQITGQEFGGTLDGAGVFHRPFWETQRKTFWDARTRKALELGIIKPPTTKSLWIDDLKIKSKIDKLHPVQLFGYLKLLQEETKKTFDWGLIVRREKKLDKKPEIQLKGYYLPLYEPEWNSAMSLWKFLNK